MSVQHISAITLVTGDMRRSTSFYESLGFAVVHGGPDADFTSLQIGEAFVNLIAASGPSPGWWGRVIFRVDDVDAFHHGLASRGISAPRPEDAPWGERYFHLTDPDGHELSFAQRLRGGE